MEDARNEIVELLPQLRGFARSLCGGDAALADDLVQDTVVLALRAWHSFTPGTSLKSWLLKILHNRFHSLKRRKFQTSEIARDDLDALASVPPSQDSRLEVAAFKQAFAHLKPEHRNVLVLSVVHGQPYEAIAHICGCQVGTVKSRISRARNQLREIMLGASAEPAIRPAAAPARKAVLAPPRRIAPPAPAVVPAAPRPSVPSGSPVLAHIASAERQIVQAELMLTRYRRLGERLARTPVDLGGVRCLLERAGTHLRSLHAFRERLLQA